MAQNQSIEFSICILPQKLKKFSFLRRDGFVCKWVSCRIRVSVNQFASLTFCLLRLIMLFFSLSSHFMLSGGEHIFLFDVDMQVVCLLLMQSLLEFACTKIWGFFFFGGFGLVDYLELDSYSAFSFAIYVSIC